MFNQNGPLKGANVVSNQDAYDLIYKDVSIKSENRNATRYPNPNDYSINLNYKFNKIYKAEIIALNLPGSTDITVNITNSSNRLYFEYTNIDTAINITGYLEIQAGTYLNPTAIATEVNTQLGIVISAAGLNNTITVSYDTNLNRYIFVDSQTTSGQFILYPTDGTTITGYTVTNSLGPSMKLTSQNSTEALNINTDANGQLFVGPAAAGDYGSYTESGTTTTVPLNNTNEPIFGNSIISGVVLIDCSVYLSLGQLNGDTLLIAPDESGNNNNIPPVFCQIPNNTYLGTENIKSVFGEPAVWSAVSFYNPPISNIDKFEIKWYNESGSLINVLDHCFTIRIYYFQKRIGTTEFSVSLLNNAVSGTTDSIFDGRINR
jgi:hypothetical protein